MTGAQKATPSVSEELVTTVVTEVSKRMGNPQYGELAIGTFVQSQPEMSRFLSAHADELGGAEGVMHAVFHAQVLSECFQKSRNQDVPVVPFSLLDETHTDDPMKTLESCEPAVASYVASNIDSVSAQRLLAHLGLALHRTGLGE